MREIRLAAKQRNGGALQYHFGDMDGLLRALIERELPLLTDRRKALLAIADRAGADDLWSVAAVWALPYAQLATGSERERYVVRFLSQLHDDTSLPLEKIAGLVADPTTDEAFRLLRERVSGRAQRRDSFGAGADRHQQFRARGLHQGQWAVEQCQR